MTHALQLKQCACMASCCTEDSSAHASASAQGCGSRHSCEHRQRGWPTWISASWQLAPHSRRRAANSAARSGGPGGASSMQTSRRPAARSTGATSLAALAVAHTATARNVCGEPHDVAFSAPLCSNDAHHVHTISQRRQPPATVRAAPFVGITAARPSDEACFTDDWHGATPGRGSRSSPCGASISSSASASHSARADARCPGAASGPSDELGHSRCRSSSTSSAGMRSCASRSCRPHHAAELWMRAGTGSYTMRCAHSSNVPVHSQLSLSARVSS